jgi:hypothetical protein
MATIIFNGQTYTSVEAMPPEARQAYEQALALLADNDRDGIPDIIQGAMAGQASVMQMGTRIVVNGQAYASLDEMPPEARRAYDQVADLFDRNRDGIPDIWQDDMPDLVPQEVVEPADAAASRPLPRPAQPEVTEVGPDRLRGVAVVVALVLLGVVALVVLLTLWPGLGR